MPEFPSFPKAACLLSLGRLSSLEVHIQLLWNPLVCLQSDCRASHFASATRDYCGPSQNHFPLHFCNLLLSSFLASIYSNLLTIRSPVCSESCSLFSFCFKQKLKSPPQPARPRVHQLCLLLLSLPTHPSTHITLSSLFFPRLAGGIWQQRPCPDSSARYLCVS